MADIKTLPESTRLKITYRKIGELIPYTGNARTHSDKQIAQIAASIRQFGFTNPVLIDEDGSIVAGHGRVAAAKQLGIAEVPTIVLGHLTPAERRAYVIADNRLAELAGWDREILKIEFQALAELDLDFDLEITGFETAELDLLLDDSAGEDLCTLKVNFRSGRAIVEGSERVLETMLDRSNVSRRLKRSALRAREDAPPGEWQVEDCRGRLWDDVVTFVKRRLEDFPKDRSVAILCRSNAEVDRLREPLTAVLPGLRVQKRSEILNVADCRHFGLWLDLLDRRIAQGDDVATTQLRDALLVDFRTTVRIPETNGEGQVMKDLAALWTCVQEEDRESRLSDVAGFLRSWLRPDDVDRLVGRGATRILSTIHKVKGLEFDEVIVMPSSSVFPMGREDPARAAAEEARVLYVACTRAKEHMLRLHGDREAAWIAVPPRKFEGSDESRFLNGNGAEIDLGWTADGRGFNVDPAGLHDYIEAHVAVGDALSIGRSGGGAGRSLFHVDAAGNRRQVGFLAFGTGSAGTEADLRVAAVVRFVPDVPPRWANGRAWAYAVLVEGRLR